MTVDVTDPRNLTNSMNFAVTIDEAPVLPAVNSTNSITLANGQVSYTAPLGATSPDGSPLTYTTTKGDSPLFDLQQQYQFTGVGYFTAGAAAYVLHSNQAGPGVAGYYLLRPTDGGLFAYDGSGSYAHSFRQRHAARNARERTSTPTRRSC